MATNASVSERDYLTTDYEYPPEFVNGVLEERPMPTWTHAEMQAALIVWFAHHHPQLRALPELRYHVLPASYRLPDLVVVSRDMKPEETLRTTPLIVVEILSPDDRVPKLMAKLKEYASAGVPAIWILDPENRCGYQFISGEGLKPAQELIADGGIALSLEAFFA